MLRPKGGRIDHNSSAPNGTSQRIGSTCPKKGESYESLPSITIGIAPVGSCLGGGRLRATTPRRAHRCATTAPTEEVAAPATEVAAPEPRPRCQPQKRRRACVLVDGTQPAGLYPPTSTGPPGHLDYLLYDPLVGHDEKMTRSKARSGDFVGNRRRSGNLDLQPARGRHLPRRHPL